MLQARYSIPAFAVALALPTYVQAEEGAPEADQAGALNAPNTEREPDEEGQIIVYGRAIEQIGVARSGSQGTVGYSDFDNVPISRTGELVENVPGVVATQHSGSGKANQYFLRGHCQSKCTG